MSNTVESNKNNPAEEKNNVSIENDNGAKDKAGDKAKKKKRRRRWGDRAEGYKVRGIQPMNRLTAYIMPQRNDACNQFSDSFELSAAEPYCRKKVKEGYTNFSMLHIFLAAYVRMISQRPAINRFVSGQTIYHRHDIEISMVVKKELTSESPDTSIKVYFEPTDTIDDVYRKFNDVVTESKANAENGIDSLMKILNYIPRLLLRWTVKFLNFLDYFGLLPRFLTKLSPFHGTMIITSMGSLGIKPIYHHLYNFGNLPVFLSYGTKRTEYEINKNGEVEKHRYIDMNVVTDERICDGFYYASAFKLLRRYIENPELLEQPPEEVFEDID